ncbi:hypothetical protein [Arthrobacter sp. E3]|uniref:hypothetical protein n=1 Tax=Arthrobacter sp. E3 TaxID=517402 RepID=UPI001A947174|nr:hypothetical protein [Arthrobacter sp. E3]
MFILEAVGHALAIAGSMAWQILWPPVLGFTLSAVIQAIVRKERIVAIVHDDSPRSLTIAAGLGPQHRHLSINDAGISWNYTTWLNIAFIVIGLTLLAVFFRSGSGNMLEMMGGSSDSGHDHTVGDHTAD